MKQKPLFEGEFIAFSPFDRYALCELIRRLKKPFKRIAEIGSWMGNGSTRTITEAICGRGVLYSIYSIDHWQGNANVARHQNLVTQFDIFNTFRANVEDYGGAICVKPLIMSSLEASQIVRDEVFDLVFIDGTHSYEQTRQDIECWLPKVVPEGILCGHDCEARLSNFEREVLWANRDQDTIEWTRLFPLVHPGVILAVDER